VRRESIRILQLSIASSRNGDYKLFNLLKTKYDYTEGKANIIMDLLHNTYLAEKAQSRPETFETLIEYLDSKDQIIRELSAWRLYQLVPAGRDIPYAAVADSAIRQKAQAAWRKLIPPGKLPPRMTK
jgi:hypothetical protein